MLSVNAFDDDDDDDDDVGICVFVYGVVWLKP